MLKIYKYLISTFLTKVKIKNMNKCVNLKNFYSEENTYKKDDIC